MGVGYAQLTHQWRLVRQAFAVVQLRGRVILIGTGRLCHLLVVIAAVRRSRQRLVEDQLGSGVYER